jgi:hypothetical protein
MGADFGTIAIVSLVIFGALEFSLIIIPAMIRRSKVRNTYQPVFDVPVVLSRPVSSRHGAQMRSWYFDETDPHRFIKNIHLDPAVPVNAGGDSSILPVKQHYGNPKPGKDWKAVNKANRAILRANKAVLEANHAILEANTAIRQAGEDDLEWMDEIADLRQLRFPPH